MTTKKIVICDRCNGVGKLIVEYYKSSKDNHPASCPTCKGEGRLVQIITVTTVSLGEEDIHMNSECWKENAMDKVITSVNI